MHNKNQITSARPGQYFTLQSKSSSLSIRVIFLQQMASSTGTPETSSDFPPQHLLRESFTRNQVTHLQISTSRRDANAYRSDRWLWRADESTLATKLANICGNCPVIHTDDFDSWDHPLDWYPRVVEQAMEPLRHNQIAQFQKFDWQANLLGQREAENPVL